MELPHVGMPNAGEEWSDDVPDVHEGMLLAVLFVAIVLIVVGMALGYFATGVALAGFLPFVRGDRWDGKGDHPHPGDVLVLIVCIVGFVVLWATGVLK